MCSIKALSAKAKALAKQTDITDDEVQMNTKPMLLAVSLCGRYRD